MSIYEAIEALAMSIDPATGGIIDIEKFEAAEQVISRYEKIEKERKR